MSKCKDIFCLSTLDVSVTTEHLVFQLHNYFKYSLAVRQIYFSHFVTLILNYSVLLIDQNSCLMPQVFLKHPTN